MESQRKFILEEIRTRDDDPDDLDVDAFAGAVFPGHPIGREIVGTRETIEGMPRERIADYHRTHYQPDNLVVAAAGNVDHDGVVALVEDALRVDDGPARPARLLHDGEPGPEALAVVEDDLEQVHLVLGTRALALDDPDRYAFGVLNQVLGGGMASRLFQEVREQRGLAYSVYSFRAAYAETGALGIYAGTAPERVGELLEVLHAQLDRLVADGGVSGRELDLAKGHIVGSAAVSLESSSSRMNRIGQSLLTHGEVPTLDEVVARFDAVTATDVARVVDRVLRDVPRTLAAVGPVTEADLAGAAV